MSNADLKEKIQNILNETSSKKEIKEIIENILKWKEINDNIRELAYNYSEEHKECYKDLEIKHALFDAFKRGAETIIDMLPQFNYSTKHKSDDWESDEEIFVPEEECSKPFNTPKTLGCCDKSLTECTQGPFI